MICHHVTIFVERLNSSPMSSITLNIILIISTIVVISFALALRALRRRLQDTQISPGIRDGMLLEIKVPKFNEQGPVAAGIMFSALHGLIEKEDEQSHVSFEIAADKTGIKFYTYVPRYFEKFVKSQIYAQYPEAEIFEVEDYTRTIDEAKGAIAAANLTLSKPYYFPIKTFPDFEVDPLAAITSAVDERAGDQRAWFQVLINPIDDTWQKVGYEYIAAVKNREDFGPGENEIVVVLRGIFKEFFEVFMDLVTNIFTGSINGATSDEKKKEGEKQKALTAGEETAIAYIEKKMSRLGFKASLRVVGYGANPEEASRQVGALTSALKQFSAANLNSFVTNMQEDPTKSLQDFRERILDPGNASNPLIFDTEELASIFHLPNTSVATPNIAWTKAKRIEYPLELPVGIEPVLGVTSFRAEEIEFGIKRDDRRRHMYLVGKTGTGKSTLLQRMAISDIQNGEGIAFIDPHGDSIDLILNYIPDNRVDDVILFDPADIYHPIAMNMLELFDPEQKSLVASALIEVFKQRFEFSWGPRMEHILRNCILSLLEVPGSTLLGISRILTDRTYRRYIVHLLEDPVMIDFWNSEFPQLEESRQGAEAIAPIQNRLGQFLSSPTVRNMVSNARSTVRLDEVMDQGKILLANLSKGKIGDDNSNILGTLLVTRLQFAALSRVKIPEQDRKDFFLYVDEFQNFVTSSFATILSEARKYRLALIITHQYLGQLEQAGLANPKEVRDAVFGNVGTIASYTVGQEDGEILSKEFSEVFDVSDFVSLERFHYYIKLMIDLTQSRPFSAKGLPINTNLKTDNVQKVIESSRKQFSVPRELVEKRIDMWNKKVFAPGMDDDKVHKIREEMRLRADLSRVQKLEEHV